MIRRLKLCYLLTLVRAISTLSISTARLQAKR
jgi:hypothetical protein